MNVYQLKTLKKNIKELETALKKQTKDFDTLF